MPRPGGTGLDVEGRVGEASAAWAQRDAARDVAADDDDVGLPAVRPTRRRTGVLSAGTRRREWPHRPAVTDAAPASTPAAGRGGQV